MEFILYKKIDLDFSTKDLNLNFLLRVIQIHANLL